MSSSRANNGATAIEVDCCGTSGALRAAISTRRLLERYRTADRLGREVESTRGYCPVAIVILTGGRDDAVMQAFLLGERLGAECLHKNNKNPNSSHVWTPRVCTSSRQDFAATPHTLQIHMRSPKSTTWFFRSRLPTLALFLFNPHC